MKLVIAEKPSVGQSLAKVLGATKRCDGYLEGGDWIVSWCIGHLVALAEPDAYDPHYKKWDRDDLPILPKEWQYKVTEATKKQFAVLKELMSRADVTTIVNGCDSGREGELIFCLVYQQCGCKKPIERLWISSMEDSAIREGFANLRPGSEYDLLYEAALCRERADWIVGINATRLFSVLYGRTLHVGRVLSPTLAMTVLRGAEIAGFVPETFYTVEITLPDAVAVSGRIKDRYAASALARSCEGGTAVVTKCERKEKSEKPPALYDLTSLQRDANRILGYTAQQTLDYAQSLYEKKLITYPRTDSRYLPEAMAEKVPELVRISAETFGLTRPDKCSADAVINGKKVSDHHALVPTAGISELDLHDLPAGEREILKMIATRLTASVTPVCRYTETTAEFRCEDNVFTAKGKTVLNAGWRAIERPEKSEKKETELPVMQVGDAFPIVSTQIKEGRTKPKPHYTEDTLLSAMERAGAEEMPEEAERKGIGTPATRADVIERLVPRGFLERKGSKKAKNLIPTEKATALITVLPEQLQSASMTAEWEEKLQMIECGEYSPEAFMAEITHMVTDLVQSYQIVKDAAIIMPDKRKVLGRCPVCGSDVVERSKSYSCCNRQCKFTLWKDNRYFASFGKQMTQTMAKKLLQNGSARLKDCYSKRRNRNIDATVFMDFTEDGQVQFKIKESEIR